MDDQMGVAAVPGRHAADFARRVVEEDLDRAEHWFRAKGLPVAWTIDGATTFPTYQPSHAPTDCGSAGTDGGGGGRTSIGRIPGSEPTDGPLSRLGAGAEPTDGPIPR